mmetsp:Transcript_23843/g.45498  ORF Transcript_23843/g.45498 Transcript_23843/m.45498 type:complete len:351 (+) Transcript_23843:71-1123(+)
MRRVVCASARAFVSPLREGGGNPVSIFLSSEPTTSDERVKLAQTCPWESIIIEKETDKSSHDGDDGSPPPKFHFFVPSGEEVSFCGHAAIGACSFLANKKSITSHGNNSPSAIMLSSVTTVPFLTAADGARYNAKVEGNEVKLIMDTKHSETKCNSQSFSLEDILSEIGLDMRDVPSKKCDDGINWPTFINSSVARPKTLIPMISMERLHAAISPQNPTKFRQMCDSIHSTGIYLYSTFTKDEIEEAKLNERDLALECRQFPRSSGYPEDPATGIAAGALAASLHKRQIKLDIMEDEGIQYDVFQGTAMGKPSKIRVEIGDYTSKETNPSLKIVYTGLVVFDSLSYLNLE